MFEALWDGVVADVYEELAGLPRRKLFDKRVVEGAMRRVATRFAHAHRALVVTAVYWPVRLKGERRHVAAGGAGGAASAAAEELAAFGSVGAGAAVAIASAVVGELFEVYVAASGRVEQYERAGRSPAPDLVVADLAESLGFSGAAGRRAGGTLTLQALHWLDGYLTRRATRRFSRALLPVAGVFIGAGAGGSGVRRVLRAPLRPASEDEVLRLAREIVDDPAHREAAYEADRQRFAAFEPTLEVTERSES